MLRQVALDLLVGDVDPAGDAALLELADQHLAANLLAHRGQRQPLAFKGVGELIEAHAVVLGHRTHRPVELGVVDRQVGLLSHLQLDLLDDHAIEHLPAKRLIGRHGDVAVGQLAAGLSDPITQFAGHDGVVVDHGDDTVERLLGGRCQGGESQHQRQAQRCKQTSAHENLFFQNGVG